MPCPMTVWTFNLGKEGKDEIIGLIYSCLICKVGLRWGSCEGYRRGRTETIIFCIGQGPAKPLFYGRWY